MVKFAIEKHGDCKEKADEYVKTFSSFKVFEAREFFKEFFLMIIPDYEFMDKILYGESNYSRNSHWVASDGVRVYDWTAEPNLISLDEWLIFFIDYYLKI